MKTLNDVINAVQQETQLSRSQLSLKIGKSRNYLNTAVKNGLSHEKEQEIIALLLDLVDDEVTMLRKQVTEKDDEIATKNLFIDGLDMENKGLMDRISKLEKDLKHVERVTDKSCELNDELIRDSKKLMSKIEYLEKTINSLKNTQEDIQVSNEIAMKDIELQEKNIKEKSIINKEKNKEITKNRILTASIIGLVAIFSVYLWVK